MEVLSLTKLNERYAEKRKDVQISEPGSEARVIDLSGGRLTIEQMVDKALRKYLDEQKGK
ncbi:MAG TPA: hypothetical protein VJI67_02225 [archaeon]|nr:hypothetical protein [archaeon]HLD80426.1 hypothetical protein [archaeon]